MTKPKSTETEVIRAIETILSDKKSYSTSLNYAVNYCQNALTYTGHTLAMQIPYILNNITHWRHPEAKRVREVLKNFKT